MIKNLVDSEYVETVVPKDVMNAVKLESVHYEDLKPYNSALAGNIKREYVLESCRGYVRDYVENTAREWRTGKWNMVDLWINLMAKHEFNPPHRHGGDLSFVMFVDVPYQIEDEVNMYPDTSASCSGHFSFQFANMYGDLCEKFIPVDKLYNNKMFMFPSKLKHCVYPFYTSDEFRVTVSGNLERA